MYCADNTEDQFEVEEEGWNSTSWGEEFGGPHVSPCKISDSQVGKPSKTNLLSRMTLNDNKAGMEGLDRDKINKIIMDASKGSRFYENEEKKEIKVKKRIEEQRKKMGKITEKQLTDSQAEADKLLVQLDSTRDLSQTIVHIDMDAFYAAVEMRDNPALKDIPMAVGSTSMLSTSNYIARRYGVRAAMPGFIGRKLCPDLVIVPANFEKYTAVSRQVRTVFADYDPYHCPVSLDEAYLDITEHLKRRQSYSTEQRTFEYSAVKSCASFSSAARTNDKHGSKGSQAVTHETGDPDVGDISSDEELDCLMRDETPDRETDGVKLKEAPPEQTKRKCCKGDNKLGAVSDSKVFGFGAEETVREMRFRIEQLTGLTASAGIAPNMMLAKVCSDKNKPNGQYRIEPTSDAVMAFIQELPIRKISGIGKVTESMLRALDITTCLDLYKKRALLYHLYSAISFNYFMRISIGIGSTKVERDEERKSMSVERTFRELNRPEDLYTKCLELSKALARDLKDENLKGRTVTIKLKTVSFEVKTRAHTLVEHTSEPDVIYTSARALLKLEIKACHPQPLRLRLMGIRSSNFQSMLGNDSPEKKQATLNDLLKRKKYATAHSSVIDSSVRRSCCAALLASTKTDRRSSYGAALPVVSDTSMNSAFDAPTVNVTSAKSSCSAVCPNVKPSESKRNPPNSKQLGVDGPVRVDQHFHHSDSKYDLNTSRELTTTSTHCEFSTSGHTTFDNCFADKFDPDESHLVNHSEIHVMYPADTDSYTVKPKGDLLHSACSTEVSGVPTQICAATDNSTSSITIAKPLCLATPCLLDVSSIGSNLIYNGMDGAAHIPSDQPKSTSLLTNGVPCVSESGRDTSNCQGASNSGMLDMGKSESTDTSNLGFSVKLLDADAVHSEDAKIAVQNGCSTDVTDSLTNDVFETQEQSSQTTTLDFTCPVCNSCVVCLNMREFNIHLDNCLGGSCTNDDKNTHSFPKKSPRITRSKGGSKNNNKKETSDNRKQGREKALCSLNMTLDQYIIDPCKGGTFKDISTNFRRSSEGWHEGSSTHTKKLSGGVQQSRTAPATSEDKPNDYWTSVDDQICCGAVNNGASDMCVVSKSKMIIDPVYKEHASISSNLPNQDVQPTEVHGQQEGQGVERSKDSDINSDSLCGSSTFSLNESLASKSLVKYSSFIQSQKVNSDHSFTKDSSSPAADLPNQFTCPICEQILKVRSLDAFNRHIDGCLSVKGKKESKGNKRKVGYNSSQSSTKKAKIQLSQTQASCGTTIEKLWK